MKKVHSWCFHLFLLQVIYAQITRVLYHLLLGVKEITKILVNNRFTLLITGIQVSIFCFIFIFLLCLSTIYRITEISMIKVILYCNKSKCNSTRLVQINKTI